MTQEGHISHEAACQLCDSGWTTLSSVWAGFKEWQFHFMF